MIGAGQSVKCGTSKKEYNVADDKPVQVYVFDAFNSVEKVQIYKMDMSQSTDPEQRMLRTNGDPPEPFEKAQENQRKLDQTSVIPKVSPADAGILTAC